MTLPADLVLCCVFPISTTEALKLVCKVEAIRRDVSAVGVKGWAVNTECQCTLEAYGITVPGSALGAVGDDSLSVVHVLHLLTP